MQSPPSHSIFQEPNTPTWRTQSWRLILTVGLKKSCTALPHSLPDSHSWQKSCITESHPGHPSNEQGAMNLRRMPGSAWHQGVHALRAPKPHMRFCATDIIADTVVYDNFREKHSFIILYLAEGMFLVNKHNKVLKSQQFIDPKNFPAGPHMFILLSYIFFFLILSTQSVDCCYRNALIWANCAVHTGHASNTQLRSHVLPSPPTEWTRCLSSIMSFCHLQQQQASETNTQQIAPSERRKQIKQLLYFFLKLPTIPQKVCWLMNVCDNGKMLDLLGNRYILPKDTIYNCFSFVLYSVLPSNQLWKIHILKLFLSTKKTVSH